MYSAVSLKSIREVFTGKLLMRRAMNTIAKGRKLLELMQGAIHLLNDEGISKISHIISDTIDNKIETGEIRVIDDESHL